MGFRTISAYAGIGTAVIGLGLVFIPVSGEYPDATQSAKQIGTFYATNSGAVVAQSLGSVLLFMLIIVFAAGLWATLRDAERERGEAWSVVGLLGATATAASYTVAAGLTLTLARHANETNIGQDALVVALFGVQDAVYQFGSAFLAMYLVGFSLAGQRGHAMPGWLSGLGYISAGLALLGTLGALGFIGLATLAFYVGSVGFLVWTLLGAIRLARASTPPVPREAANR
jgi:cbb3-type cytochrome oxidase subunit 3